MDKEKVRVLLNLIIKIHKLEKPNDDYNWGKREGPNLISKTNAVMFMRELFVAHEILPVRVAPTIEEGIFLRYKNGYKDLIVEAYNDSDIGLILTEGKKCMYNEDISYPFDFSFLEKYNFVKRSKNEVQG